MTTLADNMRALRAWHIVVLAAVPFIVAGLVYGAYAVATRDADDSLAEDQQLIPVQRGDLVNDVSISGSLAYSERETLTFDIQGTLGRIEVEEGQTVAVNEVLATLDTASIGSLEKAVAEAEVELQDAQDALEALQEPPTPLETAQAELKVANAELALQQAHEAVVALGATTASEIGKAEAAIAAARLSLQKAEEAVSDFMAPTPLEVEAAAAKVNDARVAVESAQAKLATLFEGPAKEDVAKAQSQIDAARSTLSIAETDVELARAEWDARIEDANEDMATAAEDYRAVMTKWFGMHLTDRDLATDIDDLLRRYGIDLEVLFDRTRHGRLSGSSRIYWYDPPPPDDPATPWNDTAVYTWLNLWPGTLLPTCDDRTIPEKGACVKKELEDASIVYDTASEALEMTLTLWDKAITTAESKVAQAEQSVADADARLAALHDEADPIDVEVQKSKITLAITSLNAARDDLSTLTAEPDSIELEAKKRQVVVAQTEIDDAMEALNELMSGPDPVELAAKERQVAVARASLDEAIEELAALGAGPDPLEVALREAEIEAAQSQLDDALENLASATLRAPMAGIISEVSAEVGQQISLNTPILEILDPTVVEVQGSVDEIDVLFVTVGAAASITMDALPGQTLTGTVSEIAATATSQQGVVTYPLSIRVEIPADAQLPEGLTAVASVVIREDRNVLLVPLDALRGTFQEPTLRVKTVAGIVDRPVTLGNSDDFWVVVTEGVAENDSIVMEVRDASTFNFGGFGAIRQLGGGFGGRRPSGGGGQRP